MESSIAIAAPAFMVGRITAFEIICLFWEPIVAPGSLPDR